MTDKRDAVIEAAQVWADKRWGTQERSNYTNWDVIDAADFAIQHASDVRRQIADELAEIRSNVVDVEFLQGRLDIFEEQLRGNK